MKFTNWAGGNDVGRCATNRTNLFRNALLFHSMLISRSVCSSFPPFQLKQFESAFINQSV